MERKLLLVFALTFLVIMLFQPLLKKYGPQPPAKPEIAQPAAKSRRKLRQRPTEPATDWRQPSPRRELTACKAPRCPA